MFRIILFAILACPLAIAPDALACGDPVHVADGKSGKCLAATGGGATDWVCNEDEFLFGAYSSVLWGSDLPFCSDKDRLLLRGKYWEKQAQVARGAAMVLLLFLIAVVVMLKKARVGKVDQAR